MIKTVFRLSLLIFILSLNLLVPARQASADSLVTVFPIDSEAYSITAGPDGNMWFTERSANKIGRITPAGVVTEFDIPTANSNPWGITAGPDGNLWFTEEFGNKIGRITPSGTITEFTIPTATSNPRGITVGPDGALWFTEWKGNKIGQITTGGSITEYSITPFLANAQPNDISTIPGGKLRFTVKGKIGTIVAANGSISLASTQCCPMVGNIATGTADGDTWFTYFETSYPKLGRVDPISNTIVEYTIPNMEFAWDVTMGGDGAVWFTKFTGTNMRIGRITKTGVNTEYALPSGNYWGITTGADGAIWFAGAGIGRIDPGSVQEYAIPLPNSEPVGVIVIRNDTTGDDEVWGVSCNTDMGFEFQEGQRFTTIEIPAGCPWEIDLGPGGDDISNTTGPRSEPQPISREPMTTTQKHGLWFTAKDSNQVGTMSISGTVTLFTVPTANSQPQGLAYGADNAMWFTEYAGNKIGRVTITGTISEYPIPTANSNPYDIAPGADGNLWFTEYSGNKIGRITTAGVITEFPLPHASSKPQSITAGPDGNLWFAEGAGRIGRITPAGVITEFNLSNAAGNPTGITSDKDNTLWFTLPGSNKIGRITTAGVIEEFPIVTPNSYPLGIAVDSNGKVWFTERDANQLASMTPPPAPPAPAYTIYLPVSLKQTGAGW